MKVKITPSKVSGTIAIPASKSISHRAIICASLAQGKSTITNLTFSKDIEATISCMRSFGAKIEVQKNSCIIEGCNLFDLQDGICCDCNESGSTLRFLIPAGALSNKKVTYLGKGRLLERPMGIYQKYLMSKSCYLNNHKMQSEFKGNCSLVIIKSMETFPASLSVACSLFFLF